MKNKIIKICDGIVEIEAMRGEVFIIDEQDINLLKIKNSWFIDVQGRVKATINKKNVLLHRLIMNPPKGMEIDHINRNPLDNRRCNLRICTHAENMRNRGKHDKNKKYKGVSHRNGRYVVRIRVKDKNLQFLFTNEDAAANAYNYYAKLYFGEFAYTNECPEMPNWDDFRITHKRKATSTSKYKGVSWNKKSKKWVSSVYYNGKQIRNDFESEIDAAKDYDKKVKEFGLDRKVNFNE